MNWGHPVAERFRTTLDGGIVLGRASNLPAAVNYAKAHVGERTVYIKNTTTSHHMILRPGEPPRYTNLVGEHIDQPEWAAKALRLLNF